MALYNPAPDPCVESKQVCKCRFPCAWLTLNLWLLLYVGGPQSARRLVSLPAQ